MKQALSAWTQSPPSSTLLRIALWIVDRWRPLLELAGVEFVPFRLILENRLRLEAQAETGARRARVKVGAGMLMTCLWLSLSSAGIGAVALITRDATLWLLAGQGLWFFMLALLTLNHFAALLIDTVDVGVLAPLPIRDRTVFAARIAHVLVWIVILAVCDAAIPTVCGMFVFPPLAALVAFPLGTLLTSFTVIGGVTLLFGIVLRIVGAARFQRVTLWAQVGGAIALIVCVQILPRIVPWKEVFAALDARPWLAALAPPFQVKALFQIVSGHGTSVDALIAAAGVVLPLALAFATLLFASRNFVAALADPGGLSAPSRTGFRPTWSARLAARLCKSPTARAAFGFTFAMAYRERTLLRGALPQVASITVIVILPFLRARDRHFEVGPEIVAIAIYTLVMLAPLIFTLARVSEHAKARWWFDALPAATPMALFEGARKALIVTYPIPALLVVLLVANVLTRGAALSDLVLAASGVIAVLPFQARLYLNEMPFTRAPTKSDDGDRMMRLLASMLLLAALSGVHVVVSRWTVTHVAMVTIYLATFAIGWRRLDRAGAPRRRRVPEESEGGAS